MQDRQNRQVFHMLYMFYMVKQKDIREGRTRWDDQTGGALPSNAHSAPPREIKPAPADATGRVPPPVLQFPSSVLTRAGGCGRGGCWDNDTGKCSSFFRFYFRPSYVDYSVGIRLCCPAGPRE